MFVGYLAEKGDESGDDDDGSNSDVEEMDFENGGEASGMRNECENCKVLELQIADHEGDVLNFGELVDGLEKDKAALQEKVFGNLFVLR